MKRQKVESSVLASIGYDEQRLLLEVEFHSGRVYQYFDVPAEEVEALLQADSIGAYFNSTIRHHEYVEVDDE